MSCTKYIKEVYIRSLALVILKKDFNSSELQNLVAVKYIFVRCNFVRFF